MRNRTDIENQGYIIYSFMMYDKMVTVGAKDEHVIIYPTDDSVLSRRFSFDQQKKKTLYDFTLAAIEEWQKERVNNAEFEHSDESHRMLGCTIAAHIDQYRPPDGEEIVNIAYCPQTKTLTVKSITHKIIQL